jgi:hypothetical protein
VQSKPYEGTKFIVTFLKYWGSLRINE